ncbi:glycogen/starch/alpha-glucan phosphorylase, partial [Escherichia coli]
MRDTVFRDLHRLYPDRVNNKTNGVTFRRWLFQVNPGLTHLLVDAQGEQVLHRPEDHLQALEPFAERQDFRDEYALCRQRNKEALAARVRQLLGISLDTTAIFDVHVKRIHEYKRQLLNLLHTVALYQAIRNDPTTDWVPRVKIFA